VTEAAVVHPDLAPIAFLLGSWRGEGEGEYPGIEPFRFREELAFDHVGDPFLLVTESSWSPDGAPLHFERGALRPLGDGGSTSRSRIRSAWPRSRRARSTGRP
jgi:THAP domain-containing protein 4